MTHDSSTWLPLGWHNPCRVELPTGHHLRPIRSTDVDLDMLAVMGSQERLWSIYGEAWGWPSATLTGEQDWEDLAHHEAEMARYASFNYALFDTGETELLGCVYIDPPAKSGADAEISWWVIDWLVGGPVEQTLDDLVPQWITSEWPFTRPRYIGRDLTWGEWMALPDHIAEPRQQTMTLRFEIFPVDLEATASFYTQVLGFRLVRDERHTPEPYLALERGDVRIGAAARPDIPVRDQRRPPVGVELVLEVDDLDAEHAHVTAADWPLAEDLTDRPWGLRDFRLLDPSGYYLRITDCFT